MIGTLDKLNRIHQLSELGYNTPRIMLIPCGAVIDKKWQAEMLDLARGDAVMTVRTYHPYDDIRYPEGPFAPERPIEEAINLAQEFIKDWNVLWQEAIDINETLIAGNIQINSTGNGHYDILKGKYRVRDVNNLPPEAKKDSDSQSFTSQESIRDPAMKEVVYSLRNLPTQLGIEDEQGVIVEFNLQSKSVGVLNKPLLLWEWRLPVRQIERKITESVSVTDSVYVSVIPSGHRVYGIGPLSLPEEANNERRTLLLGGKGANLWLMQKKGLPVPAGFVLSTSFCQQLPEKEEMTLHPLIQDVNSAIANLRKVANYEKDPDRPLFVSVRSSPIVSMPGLMTTVVNVGATPTSLTELARTSNNANFAWDVGGRFLHSFLQATTNLYRDGTALELLSKTLHQIPVPKESTEVQTSFEYLLQMIAKLGIEIPKTITDQITKCIEAVLASWSSQAAIQYRASRGIPEYFGTAVIVQHMVYGNLNSSSGSGVAFSRDPTTGKNEPLVEYLERNQGEDLVSGKAIPWSTSRFKEKKRKLYQAIAFYGHELEKLFRDMQEFEFTVENSRLFLLQSRPGNRSATAELRSAYDFRHEGLITKEEAIRRIKRVNLNRLVQKTLQVTGQVPVAKATVAVTGAAAGEIALSSELAVEKGRSGHAVVLVKDQLSKDDYNAMEHSIAVLTAKGGKTSHAAVLARELGCTALVGCEELTIDYDNRTLRLGDSVIKEASYISLDGHSGSIYSGQLPYGPEVLPNALTKEILQWARELLSV